LPAAGSLAPYGGISNLPLSVRTKVTQALERAARRHENALGGGAQAAPQAAVAAPNAAARAVASDAAKLRSASAVAQAAASESAVAAARLEAAAAIEESARAAEEAARAAADAAANTLAARLRDAAPVAPPPSVVKVLDRRVNKGHETEYLVEMNDASSAWKSKDELDATARSLVGEFDRRRRAARGEVHVLRARPHEKYALQRLEVNVLTSKHGTNSLQSVLKGTAPKPLSTRVSFAEPGGPMRRRRSGG
jgi:hypothetical protein